MIQVCEEHLKPINTIGKRLVENQQRSATLELVGFDREMHDILEGMLEDSKPQLEKGINDRHFLIKTPFRYPPLDYGSRFGRVHESGIFYASLCINSLFAEVAYYRFIFMDDMEVGFNGSVTTEHTVFDVRVKADKGILLDEEPFNAFSEAWMDEVNYAACQKLGSEAREIGAGVIRYYSARSKVQGRNLAVLDHVCIEGNPRNMKAVRCTVTDEKCIFLDMNSTDSYEFKMVSFLSNGVLPRPSS